MIRADLPVRREWPLEVPAPAPGTPIEWPELEPVEAPAPVEVPA